MLLAAVAVAVPAASLAADPFEFKDGDRVVLIGSTLIEREQKYGYWELFLTLKNKGKNVTFRNIGWSGDTVHAEARGRFDYANEKKRLDHLVSLTKELKPTVIVICYGHNESFEGKEGVDKFKTGLVKLLDELKPTGARIVLMSPTPFGPTVPKEGNADLVLYRDAMNAVAENRGFAFVDLFDRVRTIDWPPNADADEIWDNGIHLTEAGYRLTAPVIGDDALPSDRWIDSDRTVGVIGQLRRTIVTKNRLFFHRWRPQNETYLFGFRKHEQGKNAAEVAEFDPLVDSAEKIVWQLSKVAK